MIIFLLPQSTHPALPVAIAVITSRNEPVKSENISWKPRSQLILINRLSQDLSPRKAEFTIHGMLRNYSDNVTKSGIQIAMLWTKDMILNLSIDWSGKTSTPIRLFLSVPGRTRLSGVRTVRKWPVSSITVFTQNDNSWKTDSPYWKESSAGIWKQEDFLSRWKKSLTKWLSVTFTDSYNFSSWRFSTEQFFPYCIAWVYHTSQGQLRCIRMVTCFVTTRRPWLKQ